MKLLLDESVTHRFRHYFPGHDVRTAQYMGWSSKSNGELLALARDEFDILITVDHGIPNQQYITDADVAVMVLYAPSNDVEDLMPLVPQVLESLETAKRGEVVSVGRSRQ